MSNILPIKPRPVINASNRGLAQSLLEDWNFAQSLASADHEAGWHIGYDGDVLGCGWCLGKAADMPRNPSMTREQYLERNIAEAGERMRIWADIVSLDVA